jgi:hypothetical protein
VVRVAETERRFILYSRYRTPDLRFVGYLAGLVLLVVAVGVVFAGNRGWGVVLVLCALVFLHRVWVIDRRRRIEVTEEMVTLVNTFSRYELLWSEFGDMS